MSTQSAVGMDAGGGAARRNRWWVPYVVGLVLGGPLGILLMIGYQVSRSRMRDVFGTLFVFVVLVNFTFVFILGEKFLENFKSH